MFFLQHGYRVIAHDHRGHGRSSQTANGHDMDTYAADVAELVHHLDLHDAIHIGHSTGGGEVIRYVARHGHGRVAKAVLISSVTPIMAQSESNPQGIPIPIFDEIRSQTATQRQQYFKDFSLPFYGYNRANAKVSEGIRDNWWRQGMMGAIKAHYDCIKAFSETDFTEDLQQVDIPVLVMHGEDNQIVPFQLLNRFTVHSHLIFANLRFQLETSSFLYTFLNDTFLPATDAAISVNDLAIQRGYGIFDFLKTVGGVPIFADDHLDRFFHSAERMRLPVGKTREELSAIIAELQRLNAIPDSGIRITLTGGVSTDTVSIGHPSLVITQHPMAPPGKDCPPPVRLISHPHQRQLPDVKTIDYLMAIHLQPYIRDRAAFDVLYHSDGAITECPRCNFFLVTSERTLVTPARNILKGITREHLLTLAADSGIPVEERDVHLNELAAAREAFITSTSRHILPVSHLDDRPIGGIAASHADRPINTAHPVARQLNQLLHNLVMRQTNTPGDYPIKTFIPPLGGKISS